MSDVADAPSSVSSPSGTDPTEVEASFSGHSSGGWDVVLGAFRSYAGTGQ